MDTFKRATSILIRNTIDILGLQNNETELINNRHNNEKVY